MTRGVPGLICGTITTDEPAAMAATDSTDTRTRSRGSHGRMFSGSLPASMREMSRMSLMIRMSRPVFASATFRSVR